MNEKRKVGRKGQVVVPKSLRERFGLKPGKNVIFEVRDGLVVLRPEKEPLEFLEEFLSVPGKLENIDLEEIERASEEQYGLP